VKQRWQLWVGLGVSGLALYLTLRQIDLDQIAQNLVLADYVYLLPATVGIVAYLVARSFRWRILLGTEVSLARAFWVTNIGYLVSNVLPFRLGDPARAVVIGRNGTVSTAAALTTVVVERVLDMLMVVMLLAVVAPFVAGSRVAVGAGLIGGGVAVFALLVLLALAFRPEWGRRSVRWVLSRVPRVDADRWASALDGLFDGLAALRSGRLALAALFWSLITWSLVVFFFWALLRAFVDHPPLLAAPFLVCVVGLGMAAPSSPGAVGVFHAIARYGLTEPFGVADDQAVAFAIVAHAFQYLIYCLLGLVGLARESISLGWLRTQVVNVEEN
jgi:uncharacterized protein (TIRG00374 family)